jgi:hypothetical protein
MEHRRVPRGGVAPPRVRRRSPTQPRRGPSHQRHRTDVLKRLNRAPCLTGREHSPGSASGALQPSCRWGGRASVTRMRAIWLRTRGLALRKRQPMPPSPTCSSVEFSSVQNFVSPPEPKSGETEAEASQPQEVSIYECRSKHRFIDWPRRYRYWCWPGRLSRSRDGFGEGGR